jgi:hypothetical protein
MEIQSNFIHTYVCMYTHIYMQIDDPNKLGMNNEPEKEVKDSYGNTVKVSKKAKLTGKVCVCVCVCVCMHTRMYICMCVHGKLVQDSYGNTVKVSKKAKLTGKVYVCVCAYTYVYMHVCSWQSSQRFIWKYSQSEQEGKAHWKGVCICVHIYGYMCVYIYGYMCMYVYVFIHKYVIDTVSK